MGVSFPLERELEGIFLRVSNLRVTLAKPAQTHLNFRLKCPKSPPPPPRPDFEKLQYFRSKLSCYMFAILYGFEELIYFHSILFCNTSANFEKLYKKNWNNFTVDFLVFCLSDFRNLGILLQ